MACAAPTHLTVFCVNFVVTVDMEHDNSCTPGFYRAFFRVEECDDNLAQVLRYLRDERIVDVHLQLFREKPYKQKEWNTFAKMLEEATPREEDDDEEDEDEDDFAEPARKQAKVVDMSETAYFKAVTSDIFHTDRNMAVAKETGKLRKCAPLKLEPDICCVYVFVDNAGESD